MLTAVAKSPSSLFNLYLKILLPPLSGLKSNISVIDVLVEDIYLGIGGYRATVAAVNSVISDQGPAPTELIALYLNAYVFPFSIPFVTMKLRARV